MRILKADFYNDTINGLDFKTGKPSSYLHGNVGDNVRAVFDVEMQLAVYANTTYGWVLKYDKSTKVGIIERTSGSWITDGFYAGMTFRMSNNGGSNYEFTGLITFVSELEIIFTYVSGAAPYPGTKEDHQIIATNDLRGALYNFGLIENTESTNYISKINDRKNQYYTKTLSIGGTTTLNVLGALGSHNSGSVQVKYASNSFGVHKLVITHDFIITPAYLDEYATVIENRQTPALFLNGNSLKYVFELETRIDYNNPNGGIIGTFDSLKGNVGWYDEELNGNQKVYSLEGTLTFLDTVDSDFIDSIHLSKETTTTVTITGANFNANTRFVVHLLSCVSEEVYRESTVDYEDTFIVDKLSVLGPNTVLGTSTITNLTASYNSATECELAITTTYQGSPDVSLDKYILAVSIADTSKALTDTDKCTLLIDSQNYQLQDDIEGLFVWNSANVAAHPDDSELFTSYRGWAQDGLKVSFDGTINTGVQAYLEGMRFEVIAWKDKKTFFTINSSRLDLGNFAVSTTGNQYFNVDSTRGFKLSSDDPFNAVTLVTDAAATNTDISGTFSLKLPWQSWEALNDELARVFIDTTKPLNGLNKLASNYEGNDYKLYIACIAEVSQDGGQPTDYAYMTELDVYRYGFDSEVTPQWVGAMTTLNSDDADTGGVLSTNEDTTIRVTMTPASGDTTDYANYVAIIRIQEENAVGETIYELSSVQPDFAGNILKPLAGQTGVQITDNTTSLTLECLVDYKKLKNGVNYNISARIFTTYAGALTPVFTFDTITHAGSGVFTFPITAKDHLGAALGAGKQVEVSFVIDAVTQWTLTGVTGDDISNFVATYSLSGSDIRPYISGEVSDGETITLNKYDLAISNYYYNATAEAITMICFATDRGYKSTPDTSIVPTQLITGYGTPIHIRPLTGTNFIFADSAKGVRKITSDTYTELVGTLANCQCTDYDSTSATIYGCSTSVGLATRLWKWDATTRKDLGGSGVATMALLLSYSVNKFYVNNAKTNSGGSGTSYADIWITSTAATGTKLELRYRNGATFSTVNFSTLANTVASTAILDQVIVDANGDVWVSGVIPVTGSVILKFSKTVAGSYYNIANWTVKLVTSANGTGSTNGDGATATAQPCMGLTIVGYDSTYGATSGTHPILFYADMGNSSYREIRHNGGVSATEKLNWTWSTPALTCGTVGGTAYTFGTGVIEVGNVYGMCMLSGDLYATGLGNPITGIIFKVDTFGDAGQVSSQLFGGTISYAEQILI